MTVIHLPLLWCVTPGREIRHALTGRTVRRLRRNAIPAPRKGCWTNLMTHIADGDQIRLPRA
jgi:hypothetical protein